ncbi:MAG: hypothetical protein RID81_07290 [Sandaracinaceae bacterium]
MVVSTVEIPGQGFEAMAFEGRGELAQIRPVTRRLALEAHRYLCRVFEAGADRGWAHFRSDTGRADRARFVTAPKPARVLPRRA